MLSASSATSSCCLCVYMHSQSVSLFSEVWHWVIGIGGCTNLEVEVDVHGDEPPEERPHLLRGVVPLSSVCLCGCRRNQTNIHQRTLVPGTNAAHTHIHLPCPPVPSPTPSARTSGSPRALPPASARAWPAGATRSGAAAAGPSSWRWRWSRRCLRLGAVSVGVGIWW